MWMPRPRQTSTEQKKPPGDAAPEGTEPKGQLMSQSSASSSANTTQAAAPQPRLPETPERLLRLKQAAAYLGVSEKTVLRWTREGRISAQRTLGGQRRFPEREVLRALRQKNPANPDYSISVEHATEEHLRMDARLSVGQEVVAHRIQGALVQAMDPGSIGAELAATALATQLGARYVRGEAGGK